MKIHKAWRECVNSSAPSHLREYRLVECESELCDVIGQTLNTGDRVAWIAGTGPDKEIKVGVLENIQETKNGEYYQVNLVCRSPESTRASVLSRGYYSKVVDGSLYWAQILKLS